MPKEITPPQKPDKEIKEMVDAMRRANERLGMQDRSPRAPMPVPPPGGKS